MTLKNMFTAIIANTWIGWDSCTASRTLQAFGHACNSFVEIFVLEHQVRCCDGQRKFDFDLEIYLSLKLFKIY
jgi:hypothetical protein